MNIRFVSLAACMCLAPVPAIAGGSVYIGVGVGTAFQDPDHHLNFDNQSANHNLFTSGMVGGRYHVNSKDDSGLFIGVETEAQVFDGGYDLRKLTLSNSMLDYRFMALAGYSVGSFDAFGRLGFVNTYSDRDSNSHNDRVWGVGMQSSLLGNLDMRLDVLTREIQTQNRLVNTRTGDQVWEVSLSLVFALLEF